MRATVNLGSVSLDLRLMRSEHYIDALEAIHRLWEAMDGNDYDTVVDCLTPDCRWLREDWCIGRDAIRKSLEKRPRKVTRHLVTNLRVEEFARTLECRHLLMFFGSLPEGPQSPPYPSPGPRAADYWVTLTAVDRGWQFSKLQGNLIFDHSNARGDGNPSAAPELPSQGGT